MEVCGEKIYRRGHGYCQRTCYLRRCGHCHDHCYCSNTTYNRGPPQDSDDDEIVPTQDDLDFIAPEKKKKRYRVIYESDDE